MESLEIKAGKAAMATVTAESTETTETAETAETAVACLYRVSTVSQLTDGDIPLQRNACRAFASAQIGWRIVAEYVERGVSGYHKEAARRNVLTAIRRDVENGAFSILLVYLFDRLGRREDETPFVAEWLTERGVTVWSVVEGPLLIKGQADRLVNYIRYWQAGSESIATSLRVAEKHRQMVQEGIYRGGPPPFGYKLITSGAVGEKGRLRHTLTINEHERATVQLMYQLESERNIGCYSVASILNEQGLFTRFGHKWTSPAVVRTLRNPIYKGDYVMGRVINTRNIKIAQPADKWTHSRKRLDMLAIVDAQTWDDVNARMDARRRRSIGRHEQRRIKECETADSHVEKLFLLGLVHCGYCGGRLAAGGKRQTTVRSMRYTRYDCPRRMRQDACTGAYGYSAAKTEHIVCIEAERLLKHAETTRGLIAAVRRDVVEKIEKRAEYAAKEHNKCVDRIATALSHGADSEEAKALARRIQETERILSAVNQAHQAVTVQADPVEVETVLKELTAVNRQKWLRFFIKRVDISRGKIDIWLNNTI